MKYYKISEEDLKYFIESRARLEALEAGGVDNWSWYCDSNADYLYDMKDEYGLNEDDVLDFEDIVNYEIKNFEEIKEDE